MDDGVRTTARIPTALHARWAAHAKRERRSLNADLIYLLEGVLGTPAVDAESPGGDSTTPPPLRGKPDSSPA
ncbi:Arc family DNA-binding protein [Streptomyces mirabilis]